MVGGGALATLTNLKFPLELEEETAASPAEAADIGGAGGFGETLATVLGGGRGTGGVFAPTTCPMGGKRVSQSRADGVAENPSTLPLFMAVGATGKCATVEPCTLVSLPYTSNVELETAPVSLMA